MKKYIYDAELISPKKPKWYIIFKMEEWGLIKLKSKLPPLYRNPLENDYEIIKDFTCHRDINCNVYECDDKGE